MTESRTQFGVHSENTGALICGPYSKKREADRECQRLNREAATGKNTEGVPINYVDVFHCAVCQSKIERCPGTSLTVTDAAGNEFELPVGRTPRGVQWCPTCETHEVEFVSVAKLPLPVRHEGQPQKYEVRIGGGQR